MDTEAYLQHVVQRGSAAHLKLMRLQSVATARPGCVCVCEYVCVLGLHLALLTPRRMPVSTPVRGVAFAAAPRRSRSQRYVS